MQSLEKDINRVWDLAVFIQMMAAFCDDIDFNDYSTLMLAFHDLIRDSDEKEIKNQLSVYEEKLNHLAIPILKKYPTKRDYRLIAHDWNQKHINDKEIFSNGIFIGWLEEQLDLTSYFKYDYTPYHFKVGLVINKGRGEIEENFLLQDAFTSLLKSQNGLKCLDEYGNKMKDQYQTAGKNQFSKSTLDSLNAIKYEVSFFSRISIISFYSFLECFVNSIGYDYYSRNFNALDKKDSEILQGSKNGKFLNLRYKIEKFQKILRTDKRAVIILSDDNQIIEPFKTLFDNYEELRNASVHYSPIKSKIWLKPHDWVAKAIDFSKLAADAALLIWKSCKETSKGPDYLGRLQYDRLYKMAQEREARINKINWL